MPRNFVGFHAFPQPLRQAVRIQRNGQLAGAHPHKAGAKGWLSVKSATLTVRNDCPIPAPPLGNAICFHHFLFYYTIRTDYLPSTDVLYGRISTRTHHAQLPARGVSLQDGGGRPHQRRSFDHFSASANDCRSRYSAQNTELQIVTAIGRPYSTFRMEFGP